MEPLPFMKRKELSGNIFEKSAVYFYGMMFAVHDKPSRCQFSAKPLLKQCLDIIDNDTEVTLPFDCELETAR